MIAGTTTVETVETVERDPEIGCGYCARVHAHLIEEGDDLVCAPGYGCAAKSPRRKAAVHTTRLPRSSSRSGAPTTPPVVRVERDSETCACGHTHATNDTVWGEVEGGRVVAYCPGCAPSARPGGLR